MADVIGDAVIVIRADKSQFNSDVTQEMGKSGKSGGFSFLTHLGANLAGRGIAAVASKVSSGFSAAFTKGFGRLEAIDTAKGKLIGLKMPAEQVQQVMDSALASVKGTAYGLGDAAGLAATMVASGIKPGQDLTRTLKLMADTATIAGTDLDDMGGIFRKVATSGKATGETLGMLMERGIPALKFLSDELGVSQEEVSKLASDGKIDFETFQRAMEKGLGGAALASGNTFRGALENVGAALGRFGANFMEPVFKQLPNLFSKAIGWLDGLSAAATLGGRIVGDALGDVVRGVQGVWSILGKGDFKGADLTFGLQEDSPIVDVLFRIREGFERVWEAAKILGGAVVDLWETFSPLLADIGKLAIGAVVASWEAFTRALEFLAPVIGAIAGWMRENDELVRIFAASVMGGVAAFKLYQFFILAVAKAKLVWAAAQKVLNGALKANPIGLIITVIGALVAGLIYAYKNSETFRNVVNGVWQGIKDVVGAVVGWFTDTVIPFFVGLWDTLSSGADGAATGMASAWQGVKDFFSGLWEGVKSVFSTALDFLAGLFLNFTPLGLIIQHWEPIVGFFSGLWEGVKTVFSTALDAIWGVVGPWVNWFMGVFKAAWGVLEFLIALPIRLAQIAVMAAWDLIRAAFQAAWDWVSGTFMGWWRTIAPLIDGVMSTVRAGIDTAWKWITDRFAQAWAWISGPFMAGYRLLSGLIDAVMTAVRNGIGVAWQWIQDRFQQAWAWVSGTFMGWWRQLTGLIDGVFTLVRNAIGAGWQWIQDRFSQAWTWVSGTFMGWWRSLTGLMETPIRLAREAIDRILDGIKTGFQTAVEFVQNTWDRIKEIVSAPVRVAIKVGNALISGFRTVAKAVGLDDIAAKLVDIPPLPAFRSGGRPNIVPGSRSNGVDSTLAVTGRGVPIARVDPGEGIVRYGAMQSLDRFHPGAFEYINRTGTLPGFFQSGRLPGYLDGGIIDFRGHRFTQEFANRIVSAERMVGRQMQITQGGWRPATSYSGTSHAGDALDIAGGGFRDFITALRKVGIAAWDRTGKGNWIPHVHGVPLPGAGIARGSASWQAQDYLAGGDGLGGRDNGPRVAADGTIIAGASDDGGGFFDWVGDLAGKFAEPLKELAGIGSSPVAEIVKAIPKMVADGMLGKVKAAATSLMDSVGNFGANVAATAMSGTTLLPQMFAIAKSMGLDRRIAHIMGITMMQEASGRTDSTPDSNSDVGIFQQRTPRDGTIEQLNNLEYAMRTFLYGTTARPGNGDSGGYHVPGLFDKNWQAMGLGQAAQAVQVSAYPSAYDKHIGLVDRMLNSYKYDSGGWLQPGVTMTRNETRKPEAVLTQSQWQSFEKVAEALADGRMTPSELVVVDADGALVGRMRVEAQSALADSYARVGGR